MTQPRAALQGDDMVDERRVAPRLTGAHRLLRRDHVGRCLGPA
jgi:hypothetical protein